MTAFEFIYLINWGNDNTFLIGIILRIEWDEAWKALNIVLSI